MPDAESSRLLAPGLTQREAEFRLAQEGFNDLPSPDRRSVFGLIAEVLREPMFGLLLGAAVLYALIGDLGEAAVLAAFATVSVSIALIQRGRSEKVLDALRDLTSPRALVVRGDVLVLVEGDRVPADAILVEGTDVRADESLLTGESVPVRKSVATSIAVASATPGGDDLPYLFSGTLVLSGTGLAVVTATGVRSEIGKIGHAVGAIEQEQPRLQAQTRRLVLIFASVGFVLSVLAVVLYGVFRGDWLQALLGGIALGMSMLPEEFPLVLTVFMVMGAWRLSRSRVLTRRAAAIETLGSATVLCTDKTGTLTRNAMSVVGLRAADAEWQRQPPEHVCKSESLKVLLEAAMLASDTKALDPMDRALHDLASRSGLSRSEVVERVKAYPLSPELPAVTHVWSAGADKPHVVAAKGAPEALARLCRMDAGARAALVKAVDELARQGMRVLGVAGGHHAGAPLPASPTQFDLRFLGLVAFADPLRESVPEAVRECRSAGIRVVMITGDYRETARAIAHEAGIADGEVLTGHDLQALDDAELARRIRDITVFARITPSQKLRIVEALKANGEVVAMTGDGVNDAPALKAAHIGIAMGGRGTDVAREASSLVLLDDDFGSIVRAVRLGRRIYDNLRKAMGYILVDTRADRGPGAAAVRPGLAAAAHADAHRVSRAHHRPRLLGGARSGARGAGHHEPAAARSAQRAAVAAIVMWSIVAGNACVRGGRGFVRERDPPWPAARGRANARVRCAGRRQSCAHFRKPHVQRIVPLSAGPPECHAGLGACDCRRADGVDAGLARAAQVLRSCRAANGGTSPVPRRLAGFACDLAGTQALLGAPSACLVEAFACAAVLEVGRNPKRGLRREARALR